MVATHPIAVGGGENNTRTRGRNGGGSERLGRRQHGNELNDRVWIFNFSSFCPSPPKTKKKNHNKTYLLPRRRRQGRCCCLREPHRALSHASLSTPSGHRPSTPSPRFLVALRSVERPLVASVTVGGSTRRVLRRRRSRGDIGTVASDDSDKVPTGGGPDPRSQSR